MNTWIAIILAAVAVYSWKIIGAYVPQRLMEKPVIARIAGLLTVALMAGLIGIQGFTSGGQLHADARIPALVVAGLLTWRKALFIVMVAAAAVVAWALRAYLGWA